MQLFIRLAVIFFLFGFNVSYALAPKSGIASSIQKSGNVLELQKILINTKDGINKKYGKNIITEVFIFGSPLILQENGQILLDNINDFDIFLLLNIKNRDSINENHIKEMFYQELIKYVVFENKKLELIPRFLNKYFFKGFFVKYLNEAYENLKKNQIMLDGKWIEVGNIELTKKYIKRFIEQLIYREGYSVNFHKFKNKYLFSKTSNDFILLKKEIQTFLDVNTYDPKIFVFHDPLEIIKDLQKQQSQLEGTFIDTITANVMNISS